MKVVNNVEQYRISKKETGQYLFLLLFLSYLILASLVSVLVHNTFIRIAMVWIGLIGLIITCKGKLTIRYSDGSAVLFLLLLLINIFRGTRTTSFDMAVMIPFVIWYFVEQNSREWIPKALNLLLMADTFYAIVTIFFFFNRGLYSSVAAALFPAAYSQLMEWYEEGCMAGLTSHYTINGILLATGGLLGFCNILEGGLSKRKKRRAIIQFLIIVVGLLLTGKRGPIVFMATAAFLVYYYHNADKPKGRLFKTLGFVLVILCVFFIASSIFPALGVFVNRFISLSESGDLTLGREKYWQLAIDQFKEHLIFGIGWGQFEVLAEQNYAKVADAHNNYLQLLCETGVIGFGVFLSFALMTLIRTIGTYQKTVRREIRDVQTCSLAFAVGFQIYFLLYAFSGNPLYTVTVYIPYFLACTIGKGNALYLKKLEGEKLEGSKTAYEDRYSDIP